MKKLQFTVVIAGLLALLAFVPYSVRNRQHQEQGAMPVCDETLSSLITQDEAYAAPVAGPKVFTNGIISGCSGSVTLTSGHALVRADCLAGFSGVLCAPNAVDTPSGGEIACAPTSISTQANGAASPTATYSASAINASTANATPAVVWSGIR
jgi:hypothetical protein